MFKLNNVFKSFGVLFISDIIEAIMNNYGRNSVNK